MSQINIEDIRTLIVDNTSEGEIRNHYLKVMHNCYMRLNLYNGGSITRDEYQQFLTERYNELSRHFKFLKDLKL